VTLGYFAPPPCARTGVAHYASVLLGALRSHVDVRVGQPGDVNLYHMGNNPLHKDIYRRALANPGVVILHDAVLHHFLLGQLTAEEYVAEFVYNYGAWPEDTARRLWQDRARAAADPRYFERPMVRRIAERSLSVLVHNRAALEIVRLHAPQARVREIPHLQAPSPLPPLSAVFEWRRRFGVSPHEYLFGVFGHLRESKRLWSVLEALNRVRQAALILAGDFASSDLRRAVGQALAPGGRIRWTGYLPEEEFDLCVHAVDACVNLKYPTAGESSGVSIRLMGAGKPVILTDSLENAGFPEDVCLRVDAGPAETEMLAYFMAWLVENPARGREMGRRAREHIEREHNVRSVAEKVFEAVCAAAGFEARW